MDRTVKMHGGCHVGMAVRVADTPGSGCRSDCLHRAFVLAYRDARALDEQVRRLELEEARYTDLDEGAGRRATRPDVTYKRALIDQRIPREDPDL